MPRGEPGKGQKLRQWNVYLSGVMYFVWAATKSEARSVMKSKLGLKSLRGSKVVLVGE